MRIAADASLAIRLFAPEDLPRPVRGAAAALWAWHEVATAAVPLGSEHLAEEGTGSATVRAGALRAAAETACRTHGLDAALLHSAGDALDRADAESGFADGSNLTAFLEGLVGGQARLLARLAGLRGSWQQSMASDLAKGFILVDSIVRAPAWLASGWCLFPVADMARYDVTRSDLASGIPGAGLRPLFWKQAVRARDALARGRPLIEEMPRILALRTRVGWYVALELLVHAESAEWDVWKERPSISWTMRTRARLMAVAGRTAFRRK